ncbi:hypothetical protein IR083_20900 [Dysgonomonas sp. GY75]|uniref:hypothetical protein n=1 Tax=Dysgonomonas sp. GY75 TaxID=2780419 RepID=UPI001883E88F|nr:hypothetical protein [Dysgonomonas sp. GY75]MBF0651281.1 hypothetical protein [Dysgonomonas sp. GY75]
MIYELAKHLIFTVIISLSCIAVNAVTWKGMIFYSLANSLESFFIAVMGPEAGCKICMPLFRCPMCMSGVWSFVFWVLFSFAFNPVLMVLTVCGLNVILVSFIQNIMDDGK